MIEDLLFNISIKKLKITSTNLFIKIYIEKNIYSLETNSINLELIFKSHKFLINKVKYIILGNIDDVKNYRKIIKSKIFINEIYDPINFEKIDKKSINVFNIDNVSKIKYENLLNQIEISNYLSNKNKNRPCYYAYK